VNVVGGVYRVRTTLATPPNEKIVLYVGDRFFFWFNTNARQRPVIPSKDAGSHKESSRELPRRIL
jgi:hypothetical protein